MYKTPEDMQKVIDEYFDWCDNRTKTIYDNKTAHEIVINFPAPYTMSGLARKLGFSRQALSDYKKKDEFLDTITRARERVEEDIETRLMETRNEKGAMFNLKNNFGWRDKTETELTGESGINLNIIADGRTYLSEHADSHATPEGSVVIAGEIQSSSVASESQKDSNGTNQNHN